MHEVVMVRAFHLLACFSIQTRYRNPIRALAVGPLASVHRFNEIGLFFETSGARLLRKCECAYTVVNFGARSSSCYLVQVSSAKCDYTMSITRWRVLSVRVILAMSVCRKQTVLRIIRHVPVMPSGMGMWRDLWWTYQSGSNNTYVYIPWLFMAERMQIHRLTDAWVCVWRVRCVYAISRQYSSL